MRTAYARNTALAPLPANLPNIATAKLPASYEAAKTALKKLERVDECAVWAKKAEALASYAKQAGDTSLRKMADRIQARAIKRCGELLQAIKPAKNQHAANGRAGGSAPPSRTQAAREAGLSRDQKRDALRVAKVPREEFERLVESDDPPTVTRLAEIGTATQPKPLVDLQGRDPEEFALSTQVQGRLRELAAFLDTALPTAVVRGAFPREHRPMVQHARAITRWLARLIEEVPA